jgi:hypothetical protein
MTIRGRWATTPTTDIEVMRPIASETVVRWMEALVALHEALLDTAAPQAPAQEYVGHDHAYSGGGAITHGAAACAWALSGPPLVDFAPTADGQTFAVALGQLAVNPGVDGRDGVGLELAIFALADGASFDVGLGTRTALRPDAVGVIERTEEVDGAAWTTLAVPASRDNAKFWSYRTVLTARCVGPFTGARLRIYAAIVAETREASFPPQGSLSPPPPIGGDTLSYSYMDALETDLALAEEWFDADLWLRLESAANALYECLLDRARIGAASQYIRGHDHADYGGRPAPMGFLVQSGVDSLRGCSPPFSPLLAAGVWTFADAAAVTVRSSGVAGGAVVTGIWRVPISPGLTSPAGSPPAGSPVLMGWIQMTGTALAGEVVVGQWVEITTGQRSEVATINLAGTPTYWFQIPCVGGAWNEYALELQQTTAFLPAFPVVLHAAGLEEDVIAAVAPILLPVTCAEAPSSGNRILATPIRRFT